MKLVAIFVCACVVGSFGSFLPSAGAGKAVAGIGKVGVGENRVQVSNNLRDVKKGVESDQQWASTDGKKALIDQDYEHQSKKGGADAMARAQAHKQQASGHDDSHDASHKAAAKAAAASNDKSAFDKHARTSNFDQNQAWASNDGFRKNNRKHEGISYSFDKKFNRNANENGGFNAGHSLDEHALDDKGLKRSSYDRVAGDHAAQAARGERQSADRNWNQGENAWANAGKWDKFGRNYRQAAAGHANNRDWAEKNDRANNFDGANVDERARATDALRDHSNLDRSAQREAAGFGAKSKGLYGKGAGVVSPVGYGYGYPAKRVVGDYGVSGKGLNLARGGADVATIWDSADRQKQQATGASALQDRSKQSHLANQWQADQIKGFDKKQGALLDNNGYASDANRRAHSANAANRQWADANSGKGAQQARHNQDEVARLRDNAKWNRSDRDRKVNEYRKFFNNDKKGGQNWERLKYNKDQTDDTAAGDFANKKDAANRWQDAKRYDARDQAARSANTARASDAANRDWSQDHSQDAAGAQRKAAQAQDRANHGVWAASNDRRKALVDQAKHDNRNKGQWAQDRAAWSQDYDARGLRGAKKQFGAGANVGFGGYNAYPAVGNNYNNNYYSGYPAYNQGYGNYGYAPRYGGYGGYGNNYH